MPVCLCTGAKQWNGRVVEFARRLDDTQALCSTSMGSPQIMGFQHASVGYQTVQEMFRAFGHPDTGERDLILGLFDFIRGSGTFSPMAAALRRNGFVAFATRYNGPGQAFAYGEKIERYRSLFRESMRAARFA